MKRYLVTGGSGFIGNAVVNRLIQEGNFVRIFDNEFRQSLRRRSANSRVEIIKADIRDFKKVNGACKNIDAIIHLAYINGTKYFYEKPDLVLEVAVKGIINVLDGAKNNGVKEFYLASSSEVYQTPSIIPTPENIPMVIPDPLNPRYSYGGGKMISELLAIYIGGAVFKKTIIFRPHNVYGPNMGKEHVIPELILQFLNIKKNKQKALSIQGDGSATRSFIYIDDFVEGFMILLKKGKNKQIYNICTSEEISIINLVKELSKITGDKIKITHTKIPKGATPRRCPDITKIQKLGFNPKTNLYNGLKKTYLWYNENLK